MTKPSTYFRDTLPPPHTCQKCKYGYAEKSLSLSEKGKTMRFGNPGAQPLDVISVDQCWLKQQPACDYLILDWKERLYLVELKGSDIAKAYKQLHAMLVALVPASFTEAISCFVIANKVPSAVQAEVKNIKKKMKRWRSVTFTDRTKTHTAVIPA